MTAEPAGSRRRTFGPVVLVGLAASALAAVASAKPWLGSGRPTGSTDATFNAAFDQGTKDSVAAAVSLVLLACWGVLLVTRGVVRRGFAVLATAAAAGLLAAVVTGHRRLPGQARDGFDRALGRADPGFTAWFWTAAVAGVLALVAGVLAVRLVPHWPQMGSRYDAPADRAQATAVAEPETDREIWEAIDQGRDPTDTRE